MNFANIFFFGQYGQPDRFKACAQDAHGVWRRFDGSFMPDPKLIDGVLVCAPGDLIERMGTGTLKERFQAALYKRREQSRDGGVEAAAMGVPRVPARAEDEPKAEGSADVRNEPDGMRTWAKQWGSKRWHALKIVPDGDSAVSLCGRQILATRQGACPSWHLACSACLHVIDRRRKKRNPYRR